VLRRQAAAGGWSAHKARGHRKPGDRSVGSGSAQIAAQSWGGETQRAMGQHTCCMLASCGKPRGVLMPRQRRASWNNPPKTFGFIDVNILLTPSRPDFLAPSRRCVLLAFQHGFRSRFPFGPGPQPQRPPTLDPNAAARWQRIAPTASPWLHESRQPHAGPADGSNFSRMPAGPTGAL
jgi:hypothetical protein